MTTQKVVRTYNYDWKQSGKTLEYKELEKLLNDGYYVVMSNVFNGKEGQTQYIEYIVEKQEHPDK